jgi:signal peptidase II
MLVPGILIAVAVVILDQFAKFGIINHFASHPEMPPEVAVTGFFNLVLTMNRGISFGIFNGPGMGEIILVVVAAVIVVGLLVWLRQVKSGLLALAIGLIIGGAAGNAVDRVMRGAVVDFLDFHVGQWHPFAFNLADAAISLGVALLVLDGLLGGRGQAAE